MQKLTPLQIILIVFFIIITIVAVLIFAGVLPGIKPTETQIQPGFSDQISFWGTVPENFFVSIFEKFKGQSGIDVTYRQIPEANYISSITEALASGAGPDLWLLKEDELLSNISKTSLINKAVYSERSFRDQFLDEASDLLIWAEGFAGFPLTVDPLVLYWNRALFRSENIAAPPKNWSEFISFSEKLTKIDPSGNILQSGAAFGEFSNVRHAKDIFSLLILQSENPIVKISKTNISESEIRTQFTSTLTVPGQAALPATESAARFFSDFSDPRKTSYSWSRVLPDSREFFVQGRLAMYIGYGSEYYEIRAQNPHLDFDIAEIPQITAATPTSGPNLPAATFGHMNIMVISKQSSQLKKNAAINLINYIALDKNAQEAISKSTNHAPILRTLLAVNPADPVASIIYKSAIKARGWLDPSPRETKQVFAEIVSSSLSRRELLRDAIDKASKRLQALLDQVNIPREISTP